MNTHRCSVVFRSLLCVPLLLLTALPLAAQEAGGKSSLTFDRYPYNFTDENPLKPDSPVLLQFNVPVNPDAVEGGIRLYDQPNERFAAITASRPTPQQIEAFRQTTPVDLVPEHFVLIRPASALPLGGTWYINAGPGLASTDGSHEIIEGRLDYLGDLMPFEISEVTAANSYDSSLQLVIRHNKSSLEASFNPVKLAEYVTVSPKPEGQEILANSYQILINGKFDYGVDYTVTVRDGILANDTTQLAQVVEKKVTFMPNPGFITYPTFSTTQNSTGHRKFEIRTGNLTGLRTRVKHLEGDRKSVV